MKHEELLATARGHMWAAWQLSSEELASQAAATLIGLGMLVPEGGAQELEKSRTRVAELEAGLPAMQEALLKALDRVAELEAERHETNEALTEITVALREREASPLSVYRASHDSIVMGLYTTREAAQAHCEAKVQEEEPAGSIRHLSWSADDIGDDAEYELHITPAGTGELIRGTGYVVTPLEVAAAYDPDADE